MILTYNQKAYYLENQRLKDMSTKKKKKNNSLLSKIHLPFDLRLLPGFLILAIIPFIIRHYNGISTYGKYAWNTNGTEYIDEYLFYKALVFSILAFFMLILNIVSFVKLRKDEKKAFLKRFWPMPIYSLLILLSTLFSYDLEASIFGESGQMEPFFVLFGYSLVAMYIFLHVKDEKAISVLLTGALIGAFLVSTVGVLQTLGFKPLHTAVAKFFLFSSSIRDSMQMTDVQAEIVASTLYNPNYVGPYVMLFLPVSISVLLSKMRLWQKILAGVVTIELVIFLVGSRSKAGFMIMITVLLFSLILLGNPLKKHWFWVVPALAVLVVIVLAVIRYRDPKFFLRIQKALTVKKIEYDLKGIDTTGDCIRILYKDHEIKISYLSNEEYGFIYSLDVTDNGAKCEVVSTGENGENVIKLSNGDEFPITFARINDTYMGLTFKQNKYTYILMKHGDNYVVFNQYYKEDESYIAGPILDGYETIASTRGYAWRMAITRLKDFLFIGAGPDCYPNGVYNVGNDYAAATRGRNIDILFTRPHCYYLQMAIETGCLSVIVCLVFFIWYIVESLKLYFWKKPYGPLYFAGVGCLAAVLGFLGTGISNDSLIVVTPCFWTILGMGIVINKMNKEKVKENDK